MLIEPSTGKAKRLETRSCILNSSTESVVVDPLDDTSVLCNDQSNMGYGMLAIVVAAWWAFRKRGAVDLRFDRFFSLRGGHVTRRFLSLPCFFAAMIATCVPVMAENTQCREETLRVFDALNRDDYKTAAELLHYPEYYSTEELEEDRLDVAAVLEYVVGELGDVVVAAEDEVRTIPESFVFVSVAGGTAPYWSSRVGGRSVWRHAVFMVDGSGFLRLKTVADSDPLCRIRSLDFVLPRKDKSAQRRVAEITAGMTRVLLRE